MTAAEIALLINAALQILATVRRLGVTNDRLKELLDSDEEVTPEMIEESLGDLQRAIDEGRQG